MKGISQAQSTFIGNCYKCQKKGHKAHECRSKVINPKRKTYMDKYCPTCKMNGHAHKECYKKNNKAWTQKVTE